MATTNNWFLLDDEGSSTWATRLVEETSPYADSTTAVYTVYDFQTVYVDSPTISYDLGSDVGQIIGGGTFPFASVISETTEEYNVLDSAVQKDVEVFYSTRQEIDTQLYVLWGINTYAEADATEIVYDVGGVVEVDSPEIISDILGEVLKDIAGSYVVTGEVLKDTTATYGLTTSPLTATSLLEPTWNVYGDLVVDSVTTYVVYTGVESDNSTTYHLFIEATKDLSGSFDVGTNVQTDIEFVYDLTYIYAESDYTFNYNLESEIVIVPNVVGMPLSLATSTILATGLSIGSVTYVNL